MGVVVKERPAVDSTSPQPLTSLPAEQTTVRVFVNPHPAPDEHRLSQITDETLRRMILLRRSEMPSERLHLGGVPAINVLTAELLRRETSSQAVQR